MIHAQVTIEAYQGEHIRKGIDSVPRTFEVCGFDRISCEQKALDMYGDYSRVAGFCELDPDYPPVRQSAFSDDEDQ